MGIIVPAYEYTLIKINALKDLIMSEKDLDKLSEFKDIEQFFSYISPFFPIFEPSEYDLEVIEKKINMSYVKMIGLMMMHSPRNMREFLKDYLLKYEIINIKTIIKGILIGQDAKETRNEVDFEVEIYLGNEDFINELMDIRDLDQMELFFRRSIYGEAIMEGLLFFKQTKEIFVLDSFLERLYYTNLIGKNRNYNRKERDIIDLFSRCLIEIYNLNTIYRGVMNDIEEKILVDLLIEEHIFFKTEGLMDIFQSETVKLVRRKIMEQLHKSKKIRGLMSKTRMNEEYFIPSIKNLYKQYFFNQFSFKVDDFEYRTIYLIIEILLKKENEISYLVLPKLVDLLYEI